MPGDVGDRSRAEERYRQLIDAAPDAMIVVSEDGTIEFANVQTEKVFGYAREELVGQRLDMLIPDRFRRSHGEHVNRFRTSPTTRSMGSGLQLFGRRRDGTDIPVEVSLSPVRSAEGLSVCAAIRDVTERRRIEALAKLNADRLASAVETIEDAFALFDADDRLVLCNSVYRGFLGAVTGPLVGKSYEELLDVWIHDLVFESDAGARALPPGAPRGAPRPEGHLRGAHPGQPDPARHGLPYGRERHRQDDLGPHRRRAHCRGASRGSGPRRRPRARPRASSCRR